MEDNRHRVSSIMRTGDKIVDEANKLSDEYGKAYKSVETDPKTKDEILQKMYSDLGGKCDDKTYFDMLLYDNVEDVISSKVEEKIKGKREAFDELQNQYWDEVHDVTNEIAQRYKESDIVRNGKIIQSGESAVNNVLRDNLDTSLPSYIYRHFDDYWTNDDAYYDATDNIKRNISMDEYNNWVKTHK